MTKAEQLQRLLDITVEQVNDMILGNPQLSALEIFKNSTENAVDDLNQILKKKAGPKKVVLTVGKVDTTKMAFSLIDPDTAAILRGDLEFAEGIDMDYIGGEEPNFDHED